LSLVVVAGTGTDVGKTYVAAALLHEVRARGHLVAARKPVQSFAPGDTATDADVLALATGVSPTDVCPRHRWLETPLAPPMAAEALGRAPFTIADLAAEIATGASADMPMLVETAGGVRSPIAADGDCVGLIDALAPDVVLLVADAGIAALADHRVVVHLNRFDGVSDLHARNAEWLRTREGLDVVTDIEALVTLLEPILR
jgi:dethiobiotin synthetase